MVAVVRLLLVADLGLFEGYSVEMCENKLITILIKMKKIFYRNVQNLLFY